MSLGYAQKLSYKEDVGTVGMSELFDTPEVLDQKIRELAAMLEKCKHLVIFTGAGISTSCGIPDFRGPKGVWTLQHEGKGVPEASMPFHRAIPSLTHMALVELERVGILKFVISQNVDSLHLRSGFPREKLAELHGNSFRELCPSCGEEYIRDFEVETIGMKETSRRCSKLNCGAKLRDTVLDWEDALPRKEMNAAEKQCKIADVVLCLGTSLQITPACNLPLKSTRGGGKVVIVNLQPTPKDKKASLVIHGLVDKVITGVVQILNLRIPPYVRIDHIQLHLSYWKKKEANVKWTLKISSIHGPKAPLPFLKSIEVSFLERPDLKTAILQKQPFCLIRQTKRTKPLKMVLNLNFTEGCGCQFAQIELPINFQLSAESFSHEKGVIFQKLKATAVESASCGHNAIVEKKASLGDETSIHAIVTNVRLHDSHVASKACETGIYENGHKSKSMPPLQLDYRSDVGNIKVDMSSDQMIVKGLTEASNEELGKGMPTTEVCSTNIFGDDKESMSDGQRSPKEASSMSKGNMTQRSDKDTDLAETPLKRCKMLVSADCGQ